MNQPNEEHPYTKDHSRKSILARGCDPGLSKWAETALPPMMGNPEYVATSNDNDFIEKLKSRNWSLVYFAPGACRFSAAKRQIPGGISETQGWSLEQYRELVRSILGDDVPIVESQDENTSMIMLRKALEQAKETSP